MPNVINQYYNIESDVNGEQILAFLEKAGRTCYKSEGKMTTDSAKKFVKNIIMVGKHESVIEHFNISVRLICDRGVTHELVRHRLAFCSQESTRYCDYAKKDEITVIRPYFFHRKVTIQKSMIYGFRQWKSQNRFIES